MQGLFLILSIILFKYDDAGSSRFHWIRRRIFSFTHGFNSSAINAILIYQPFLQLIGPLVELDALRMRCTRKGY